MRHDWDQTALLVCEIHNPWADQHTALSIEDVHPLRSAKHGDRRGGGDVVQMPHDEAWELFRRAFVPHRG